MFVCFNWKSAKLKQIIHTTIMEVAEVQKIVFGVFYLMSFSGIMPHH